MSRLLARFAGFFSNRTFVGVDKSGNRYFTRKEEIDGVMKEKRWVIFKGEDEPTSVPVEWICWLNGQRKKAPTPEELLELEARRERVKLNVALLKKEEEERRARLGSSQKAANTGKVQGPNLKSFIQQFPASAEGENFKEASGSVHGKRDAEESEAETKIPLEPTQQPETTEPTGSGQSFKPGTWQPPT